MVSSLSGLESLNGKFVVPGPDASSETVSRWSDTKVGRPALIVTPENEQDVQASIRVAKLNNLTVIASGGGHGTFVPVESNALYLDMKKFKAIQLNKNGGTVQVGGGVLTGELLKALAADGYFTPLPNSNGVGVVGCVIGGGNTALSGVYGWMADIVVSFRLVTSEGESIEVSASSTGKDLTLFNALCGGGHGLGVITGITTSAYPISNLNMTEDKIWTRSLVFPAVALDTAAKIFTDLPRSSPSATHSLSILRSPPGTPAAGKPIVIVGSTSFGPTKEAEIEAAALFQEDVVKSAVAATTEMIPMANMNDRFKMFDAHGGHKTLASCRLKKMDVATIKAAYEHWLAATETDPDVQRIPLMMASVNTSKLVEIGESKVGAAKFLENRDREFMAMVVMVCQKEESLNTMTGVANRIMAEFRKGDEETVPRSIPNNLRFGISLEEMFDKERLEGLRGVKKIWDADGIFWSPYVA
ncbi:hypothetical protein B0T10DRAFT_575596 [Thelonectria olida]|uniref:FAD-binding PCMH-type domain-containing protein n=1 Tax=Thelonectria olida TaxID=1576542 RepID=A0A9P8W1U5_9HYPO|nr:hypothetical protein B0T10DRAFT_575596 [Thelonectria olida]